jgi:flagellar protein FliS
MTPNNLRQKYENSMVMTATPEKLVVLMYEGALKFLNFAKVDINDKDFVKANEHLYKVQLILGELMCSLNFDYEDISNRLFSIYSHLYDKVVQANVKKDTALIDEVSSTLEPLLNTWILAAKKVSISQNGGSRATFETVAK